VTDGPFDPLGALRALDRHGVRFVVIGGLGARLHGSPTVTNDTDVCYDRSPGNLERLADALVELKARLRGVDDEVPFLLDAATIAGGDHFTFSTTAGNLDCLGTPAGVDGFTGLAGRAQPYDVEGLRVLVASIDDLVRMKRAVGRPKDLIEIDVLRAVQEERGNR
jgi:hypothetical protein